MPDFHNPYNFVRTPGRNLEHAFVGDYDPSDSENKENHSRYWPELYTGTIPVKLRTQTPLFITAPNSKREHPDAKEHYIYDCLDYIPATALKGMLSGAYEIITNSRYRVFNAGQHKKRLGFRYQAEANLVPGRVTCENGEWKVTLFTGTSTIKSDGRAEGPLYAAWIPSSYDAQGNHLRPAIQHGKEYDATLELYPYRRGSFQLWVVKEIMTDAGLVTLRPNSVGNGPLATMTVRGYAAVTGKTVLNKHDERLFFNTKASIDPIILTETICDRYKDLVTDYQRVHKDGANPPIGKVKQGRHITDPDEQELRDGCLVYVKMEGNNVKALYPVQISRELYSVSPLDCLDKSLHPAMELRELSPADRLFGWVPQGGHQAWKGKIRISDGLKKADESPVEFFEQPMPLAILGGPKPSQARFYLGNANGMPQAGGLSKEQAGYTANKKLRGRKVYLHHRLPEKNAERDQYWNPSGAVDTEYRQFGNERTGQNRSIQSWIKPRSVFFFDIKVENLTAEELGALLVLLKNLGQGDNNHCYFRLGYAKPLGLGSAKLSIDASKEMQIYKGSELAKRYSSFDAGAAPSFSEQCQRQVIQAYQKAMSEAYNGPVENQPASERCRWKALDFAKELLSPDDLAEFERAWNGALESCDAAPPLDELPSKETLIDLYPELSKDLTAIYEEESAKFKKQSQYDFGWSKLPFIEDVIGSMQGFTDADAKVHYPRNQRGEEGFRWFAENERDGRLALPLIGKTLSSL